MKRSDIRRALIALAVSVGLMIAALAIPLAQRAAIGGKVYSALTKAQMSLSACYDQKDAAQTKPQLAAALSCIKRQNAAIDDLLSFKRRTRKPPHPTATTASPSPTQTTSSPTPTQSTSSPQPTGSLTLAPSSMQPSLLDHCMWAPRLCNMPDETNTGVPDGTPLTLYNGDLIMDTPGATYSNLDIAGCAFAAADNVTLQLSIVRNECWRSGRSETYIVDNDDKPWHVTVQDVTIDGSAIQTDGAHNRLNIKGISGSNLVVRRVRFANLADCVHYSTNVIIERSYCPLPLIPPDIAPYDPHVDAFQSASGDGVLIRWNTAKNPNDQTSAIINGTISPPQTNVVIEYNLLTGGGWVVYCNAHYTTPNPTISFGWNRIARGYYVFYYDGLPVPPRGGLWGPMTDCEGVANSATNVWDEDNSAIPVQ